MRQVCTLYQFGSSSTRFARSSGFARACVMLIVRTFVVWEMRRSPEALVTVVASFGGHIATQRGTKSLVDLADRVDVEVTSLLCTASSESVAGV